MSKSLKDQLLELGLAAKSSQNKHKSAKKHRRQKKPGNPSARGEIPLDKAFRIRQQQERDQKAQTAARKREQQRLQRETNLKIRKIVDTHVVRDVSAEHKRNFLFKGRIRSVLATKDQISALNEGILGVVYLSGNYHMLPMARVIEIQQFAPHNIPDLKGADTADESDHPVPDDLIW